MTELRRSVRRSDVEAVRALVERTAAFSAEEHAIAASLVEEALAHPGRGDYHFVFADGSSERELEGYACFGPIPATRSSFDLYWIAVDPKAHRRGLGRLLLAESERLARAMGAERMYVDTSSRDVYRPAHALYTRSGYVLAATLPDFYAPGDAKLIFVKMLAGE